MSSSVPPSTSAISTEAQAEDPQRDTTFWRYIGTKLGGAAISLFMVVILGFFLFRILPGDPVAAIARERQMTPEQIQLLREQFGLDKPLWQQFGEYIVNVFTLNFGESYVYSQPVSSLIADSLLADRCCSPAVRRSSRSCWACGSAPVPAGSATRASTRSRRRRHSCSGRCRRSGSR